MIAAALIIIFVVVRYISSSGQQASQQGDIATLQSQAELVKTNLQAKDFWDDTYRVYYNSTESGSLVIFNDANTNNQPDAGEKIAVDDNLDYVGDEVPTSVDYLSTNNGKTTLKEFYEACTKDNDENACMILLDLQDAKRP